MVQVVTYDRHWPDAFSVEAARLRAVFEAEPVSIHHIGSTSVPGLCAKPVIDILVEVTDLGVIDGVTPELERRGYLARGEYGIPGRRYFSRPATSTEWKVHIHAFLQGSPHVARHLRFRDRLRGDAALAARYCALKQRLAAEGGRDANAYQAGKEHFIRSIESEGGTSPHLAH